MPQTGILLSLADWAKTPHMWHRLRTFWNDVDSDIRALCIAIPLVVVWQWLAG